MPVYFRDKEVSGVVLDITGVLIESSSTDERGTPIPGSVEALRSLKEANIPVRFLTNETTKSRLELVKSLRSHGFTLEENDIFTPAIFANALLARESLKPFILAKKNIISEDMKDIIFDGEKDSVLLADAEEDLHHASLNQAFRILMKHPSRRLFTLGKGRYFRQDGELSLDIGPFAVALEYASGREAVVIGKPESAFFHQATQSMGIPPERAVMVGDDARSDVGGSQRAGLRGVLVRTGKYTPQDEKSPADAIVDNLSAFVRELLQ